LTGTRICMGPEHKDHEIPDWAKEEREQDIAWIKENMLILSTAASTAFKGGGRGAIVVDTTVQPVEGMGHPFDYYLQETVEETDDEDTKRMVTEYDPNREFVVVLLKPGERVSSYRVKTVVQRGRPRR
jgi:hypothetical protein